eukprot:360322-Chlamydomonas_euryale.AAC.5
MDGQMHGWTDAWMDPCMDGQMHGWTDASMDGCMDGQMHGWTDGHLHHLVLDVGLVALSMSPCHAVGGVKTVLGGVADGSRFWQPSRGGCARRVAPPATVTRRAARRGPRTTGRGAATVWRPV